MRPQPQDIALGAQRWRVRPLTVAQVQAIEPLLFAGEAAGTVATAVAILRIALARDHAAAAAELDEVEAGAPEISAALGVVLRLGGFLPAGVAAPGEAGAGATPATPKPANSTAAASTGAPFTPG